MKQYVCDRCREVFPKPLEGRPGGAIGCNDSASDFLLTAGSGPKWGIRVSALGGNDLCRSCISDILNGQRDVARAAPREEQAA